MIAIRNNRNSVFSKLTCQTMIDLMIEFQVCGRKSGDDGAYWQTTTIAFCKREGEFPQSMPTKLSSKA